MEGRWGATAESSPCFLLQNVLAPDHVHMHVCVHGYVPVCVHVCVCVCVSVYPKAGTLTHLHGFLCLQAL